MDGQDLGEAIAMVLTGYLIAALVVGAIVGGTVVAIGHWVWS